jgi:hypothetical protein
MRHIWPVVGLLLAAVVTLTGCGSGGVREETIAIRKRLPLEDAKGVLENYAKGGPMGSEVASFPKLVEDVRKTDPARAQILEKGFADLQRHGANRKEKARALLKKL